VGQVLRYKFLASPRHSSVAVVVVDLQQSGKVAHLRKKFHNQRSLQVSFSDKGFTWEKLLADEDKEAEATLKWRKQLDRDPGLKQDLQRVLLPFHGSIKVFVPMIFAYWKEMAKELVILEKEMHRNWEKAFDRDPQLKEEVRRLMRHYTQDIAIFHKTCFHDWKAWAKEEAALRVRQTIKWTRDFEHDKLLRNDARRLLLPFADNDSEGKLLHPKNHAMFIAWRERVEAVKKMGHGMEMPFLARKANEIIEANQASMLCA